MNRGQEYLEATSFVNEINAIPYSPALLMHRDAYFVHFVRSAWEADSKCCHDKRISSVLI